MFGSNRYMTKGFQNEIPFDVQLFLWGCIDSLKTQKDAEMDYLQVFQLTKEIVHDFQLQKVEHRQEVPARSRTYYLSPRQMVDATVFIIDSGEYVTALLSSEY